MIGIIDYGMGNLNSVQKAVERQNALCKLVTKPEEVLAADKLILPGVGAFEDAIHVLKQSGLAEPLLEKIKSGTPFLGICLGMQMLFERSFENGEFQGLGLFAGDVVHFQFTQQQREKAGEKLSITMWFRATRPSSPPKRRTAMNFVQQSPAKISSRRSFIRKKVRTTARSSSKIS